MKGRIALTNNTWLVYEMQDTSKTRTVTVCEEILRTNMKAENNFV